LSPFFFDLMVDKLRCLVEDAGVGDGGQPRQGLSGCAKRAEEERPKDFGIFARFCAKTGSLTIESEGTWREASGTRVQVHSDMAIGESKSGGDSDKLA
jgi:hypothetical protein